MRRALILIVVSLLLIPAYIVQAQCGILFDEGTAEFIVCTDYLNKRSAIRDQDLRMRVIGQRVANLLTGMEANRDDAAWVERIRPAIAELTDEYRTLFAGLQVFMAGEVFLVRTALDNWAGSVPDKLFATLTEQLDLDYFEQDLYTAWVAVGSDIDLLNRDLNDALAGIASPDESDVNAQQAADETTLAPLPSRTETAGEAVANAMSVCKGAAEGRELQSCIFREAWINLNAAEYCDGSNDVLCEEMRIWFSDYSDETWEQLVEEYGAADDAKAGIAVLICQLNPATREDGSVVPLGTCAQVEYLGLTGAEAGTVSNGPTEEDTDAASNTDVTIPSVGEWMMMFLGDCGGDVWFIQFVEASAERIVMGSEDDNPSVFVSTTPGTYVFQQQGDEYTYTYTLYIVAGDPEHMTGLADLPGEDTTLTCPLELVRLGEDG